jgi:hypothetical protein
MLRIDASLDISVDGQPARLRGSGRVLRFEVEETGLLRRLAAGVQQPSVDIGEVLAAQGLTVEVADRKGTLLVIGANARPGPLNRFTGSKFISPTSYGAVMRLILNG